AGALIDSGVLDEEGGELEGTGLRHVQAEEAESLRQLGSNGAGRGGRHEPPVGGIGCVELRLRTPRRRGRRQRGRRGAGGHALVELGPAHGEASGLALRTLQTAGGGTYAVRGLA